MKKLFFLSMSIIFLKHPLLPQEIDRIKHEFPQHTILSSDTVTTGDLNNVEIAYAHSFEKEDFEKMPFLRWIHSPYPSLDGLYMPKVQEKGNILVTSTKEKDVEQAGEFAVAAMLTFAKRFFEWHNVADPSSSWNNPLRDTLWTLKGRKLLQIGLGPIGTNITLRAKKIGLTVWGVDNRRTYHQHCNKTFALSRIHSLLPNVDIVSISIPRDRPYSYHFGEDELKLMKNDSILLITGCGGIVDEYQLSIFAQQPKFRGVLIDAFANPPLSKTSPLWKIPNVLITPQIASFPESSERTAFSTFLFNLRQFAAGHYSEMKNLRV
ncbi:MAG: NAD(P)-dependent oxidoreductase [Chlamydiota bacterium]